MDSWADKVIEPSLLQVRQKAIKAEGPKQEVHDLMEDRMDCGFIGSWMYWLRLPMGEGLKSQNPKHWLPRQERG